jgi:hypothetical protein
MEKQNKSRKFHVLDENGKVARYHSLSIAEAESLLVQAKDKTMSIEEQCSILTRLQQGIVGDRSTPFGVCAVESKKKAVEGVCITFFSSVEEHTPQFVREIAEALHELVTRT